MLKWVKNNALAAIALFAFVITSAMLVAQAQIITSQRELIRQLYGDSQELNARKVHDILAKHAK